MDQAYPATTSRLHVQGRATVPRSVLYGACSGSLTTFGCDDGSLHERRHLGQRHRWGCCCAMHQSPWMSQFRVSCKPARLRHLGPASVEHLPPTHHGCMVVYDVLITSVLSTSQACSLSSEPHLPTHLIATMPATGCMSL